MQSYDFFVILQFGGERFDVRVQPQWHHAHIYEEKAIKITLNASFRDNHILDTLTSAFNERLENCTLLLDFGRLVTGWFQAFFLNI